MLTGRRARIHHLTRNRRFLIRTSVAILCAGLFLGCAIHWLRSASGETGGTSLPGDPRLAELSETRRQLAASAEPQPRKVMHWLRKLISMNDQIPELMEQEEMDLTSFQENGILHTFQARDLISQHTKAGPERDGFIDFITVHLAADEPPGIAALERIRQRAAVEPPPPYANELLAHIRLAQGASADALVAFIREGASPGAETARDSALRLAIELRDRETLEDLKLTTDWITAAPPWLQSRIGAMTGDVWLQWRGILGHQISHTRWALLLLALFSATLWYVIFAQRSPKDRWRWARPMIPLIAGVCSVWPTLMILAYQEYHLGMSADSPFPHDLWYYIGGVGLREELSKLALFAFFLPWLLWRRDAGLALLTGAFVGLGFALEENIQYYNSGGGVAWTRFVTANFMHTSMTAICGHALYEMVRTRFGHAEKFVITFVAIVLAHGCYDYAIVAKNEMAQFMGIGIFSLIILAMLANQFFDLLHDLTRAGTGMISPASVFMIGSALLIAVMFIRAGLTSVDLADIAAVGSECVSIAPVAFIFLRKFELR